MGPVNIDVSDLANEFNLIGSQVDELKELAITTLTQEFARKWELQTRDLKSSREIYKGAIQTMKRGRFTGVVYLNPSVWLANAIEMGYNSFDMKVGFLSSDKVKYTKSGDPMLTIPFRFGVATSLGESQAFAGVMPVEIVKEAKQLTGKTQLQLNSIPEQFQIPKSQALRRRITEISSLPKNDRTSIYEGIQRGEGGYVNFRRVSLNSDLDSFIHPGFSEANLAEKAWQNFDVGSVMESVIDEFLSSI